MEPADILKKPYARMVLPDSDGSFAAEIVEFPGCFASGATAAEALSNLEEVAVDWIRAALEQRQEIPEPMDAAGYSGRFVTRMAQGLHKRAAFCARSEGVSLNQFIVNCVAEQVGMRARPMMMANSGVQVFANIGLQVLGLTLSNQPAALGWPVAPQQLATSSGANVLGLPIPRAREAAHARG